MKSFVMSLLGSVFINSSYVALSSLLTGSTGGHSRSVLGSVLEMNIFTLGLPIVLPATILFLVWRIYEKRHIESGKKSYMVHYTLIMFVITIAIVVTSESFMRQSSEKKVQQMNQELQRLELLKEKGRN